jgi:hypothetical protein
MHRKFKLRFSAGSCNPVDTTAIEVKAKPPKGKKRPPGALAGNDMLLRGMDDQDGGLERGSSKEGGCGPNGASFGAHDGRRKTDKPEVKRQKRVRVRWSWEVKIETNSSHFRVVLQAVRVGTVSSMILSMH